MGNALEKLLEQLSPENRAWVEALPTDRRGRLLEEWQEKGGATSLGGVDSAPSYVHADEMVTEFRESENE
ncbi:hypothetical protein ABT112_23660 [Streptomyces sp. NPDC002055]|uniref:hypothetical protein n=1 Tax=Streptomyces sp. NPDC002055 TaxID=3154534 RepID=UPI003327F673